MTTSSAASVGAGSLNSLHSGISCFRRCEEKLCSVSALCQKKSLRPAVFLYGPRGAGKSTFLSQFAQEQGMRFLSHDSYFLWSESPGSCELKVTSALAHALASPDPTLCHIKHVDLLGRDATSGEVGARIVEHFFSEVDRVIASARSGSELAPPSLVVCTAPAIADVDAKMLAGFTSYVEFPALTSSDYAALIPRIMATFDADFNVDLQQAADRCRGFTLGDLFTLFRCLVFTDQSNAAFNVADGNDGAACIAHHEARCSCSELYPTERSMLQRPTVSTADVLKELSRLSQRHAATLGSPSVPSTTWEDVGGLDNAKMAILDAITLPRDHPELYNNGLLRRSGILLYGPPGCGKTLLAKAAATECNASFLAVKGPELLNMYVGQSEANVRQIFEQAKSAAPCILFFDELDSLAPSRGRSGDSGGVMDRVVSQLLAELDESDGSVFVIAATNRPDLIDPSLLRPGRFDKAVYVGIRGDDKARLSVLRACARKLTHDKDVNLAVLLQHCPQNATGADLSQLVSQAVMKVVERSIEKETFDADLIVTQNDFLVAASELKTSVSVDELESYENVLSGR